MSRAIEQYVCASEDRSHYNTDRNIDDSFLYHMYIQALHPPVIQYIQPIKSENEKQINEILDEKSPELVETIINEIGEIVVPTLTDEEIDEIIDERTD